VQIPSVAFQDILIPTDQTNNISSSSQDAVFSREHALATKKLENTSNKPENTDTGKTGVENKVSKADTAEKEINGKSHEDLPADTPEDHIGTEKADELPILKNLIAAGISMGAFAKTDGPVAGDAKIVATLPVGKIQTGQPVNAARPQPGQVEALTAQAWTAGQPAPAATGTGEANGQTTNPIPANIEQQFSDTPKTPAETAAIKPAAVMVDDQEQQPAVPVRPVVAGRTAPQEPNPAANAPLFEPAKADAAPKITVAKIDIQATAPKTQGSAPSPELSADKVTGPVAAAPEQNTAAKPGSTEPELRQAKTQPAAPSGEKPAAAEKPPVSPDTGGKPGADPLHATIKERETITLPPWLSRVMEDTAPDQPVKNGSSLRAMEAFFTELIGRQPGAAQKPTFENPMLQRKDPATITLPTDLLQPGTKQVPVGNLLGNTGKEGGTDSNLFNTGLLQQQTAHAVTGQHAQTQAEPVMFESQFQTQGSTQSQPTNGQTDTALKLHQGAPLMENRVVDHVVERMSFSINRPLETSTVTIKMHPQELGELRIELEVNKEGVKAVLHAQTQQAHDLLERHMPRLREALALQGLRLDDVQVNINSEHADRSLFQEHRDMLTSSGREFLKHEETAMTEMKASEAPNELIIDEQGATRGINLRV